MIKGKGEEGGNQQDLGLLRRGEGDEGGGAVAGEFDLFDLEFSVLEARLADLEQAVSFFKPGKHFGKGRVAGLHGLDEGLELIEGVLEGKFGGLFFVHSRHDDVWSGCFSISVSGGRGCEWQARQVG